MRGKKKKKLQSCEKLAQATRPLRPSFFISGKQPLWTASMSTPTAPNPAPIFASHNPAAKGNVHWIPCTDWNNRSQNRKQTESTQMPSFIILDLAQTSSLLFYLLDTLQVHSVLWYVEWLEIQAAFIYKHFVIGAVGA